MGDVGAIGQAEQMRLTKPGNHPTEGAASPTPLPLDDGRRGFVAERYDSRRRAHRPRCAAVGLRITPVPRATPLPRPPLRCLSAAVDRLWTFGMTNRIRFTHGASAFRPLSSVFNPAGTARAPFQTGEPTLSVNQRRAGVEARPYGRHPHRTHVAPTPQSRRVAPRQLPFQGSRGAGAATLSAHPRRAGVEARSYGVSGGFSVKPPPPSSFIPRRGGFFCGVVVLLKKLCEGAMLWPGGAISRARASATGM